jgi:predicted transposase YbfD/YdcC
VRVNFPHVRAVIRVERASTAFTSPKDAVPGYYLYSGEQGQRTPEDLLQCIRSHWGGIEIRNHWRKDACLYEDKTRSRNPNLVGALAMLRSCLIFFLAEADHTSNICALTEEVAANSDLAVEMVFRPFR